jgi:hypothetical protein
MERRTSNKRRALNVMTVLVGIVALVTLAWPTWFETLTGEDPDGGDGSIERWVVRGVAVVAVAVVVLVARTGRRRSAAARIEGAHDHG